MATLKVTNPGLSSVTSRTGKVIDLSAGEMVEVDEALVPEMIESGFLRELTPEEKAAAAKEAEAAKAPKASKAAKSE